MVSCDNDILSTVSESKTQLQTEDIFIDESFTPVTFTEEDPTHVIMLDGQPLTITLRTGFETKSISPRVEFTEVGPLAAPTPKLFNKGNYEKYVTKLPQFSFLPSYQYVLLRLDEFGFEINLPKEAAQGGACELIPLTEEGFALNNANYKGCTLVSNVKHATGYKLTYHFYIQSGIAYDILGRQLSDNVDYPISGTKVRYNYVYWKK